MGTVFQDKKGKAKGKKQQKLHMVTMDIQTKSAIRSIRISVAICGLVYFHTELDHGSNLTY